MIKHKHFLKLGMLIFSLSILLTNCSENDEIIFQEAQLQRTITNVSYNEFKSKTIANKKFDNYSRFFDINKSSPQSIPKDKNSNKYENGKQQFEDATILTDNIIKIKKDSFTTYTFTILVPTETIEFYNLVLYLNNAQEVYESHILKYTPTDSWLSDQTQQFRGKVEISNNSLFNVDDLLKDDSNPQYRVSDDCIDNVVISYECSNGIEGHKENPRSKGCVATGFYEYITVNYAPCSAPGGGVGNGDIDPNYSGGEGDPSSGGSKGSIVTAPNMEAYTWKLKNFESGTLTPELRQYYKSGINIKNTVDTFLKDYRFSEISVKEVEAALIFGNTLELNFEQFNWVINNRSSLDLFEIKDDLIPFAVESRTIAKMKIDANRAKNGWDFSKTGTFANRPSLKYKATFKPNPGEVMYLLENGLVLYQSATKRIVNHENIPGTLANSEVPTDGYNYIYSNDTKSWFEYRMPKPTYPDADIDFLISGFWEGAKIIGRYAVPIEDAIILIDGKDFDGVAQNKVQTAGFMIVGIIPGGKITKAFKPIAKVLKGSDVARNGWKIIAKSGNKTITLSFKVVNGLVDFGSRSKLAKIINTTAFEEAHHILPWNKLNNEVIQEAAYAGFHMNSKVNGKALKKYTSLTGEGLHGNHPQYDIYVEKLLNEFKTDNIGFTSEIAKDYLENELIPNLIDLIDAAKNSNLNLNEYFRLLN